MVNKKIFNPSETKSQRKFLRNNMTNAEVKLWSELKNRQVLGIKFRRQHGIGSYIVDFYSPSLKLVIEVDGDSHFQRVGLKHDRKRDQYLSGLGLTVMRFTNTDISENTDEVMTAIHRLVNKLQP